MLTIEELKSLPIGEWVWIAESENAYPTHDFHGEYCRKTPPYLDGFCYGWQGNGGFYKYEEYGTKWFAYKNKEEAEGKSITLPCKIGDTVWVVYEDDDREYKIYEAKCMGFAFENGTSIRIVTNFCCYDYYRKGNFTDRAEAEKKLSELQGE